MTDAPQQAKVERRTFEAGEVIFKEGDPSGTAFIVQTGQVEVRKGGRRLVVLGVDGLFGEGAFLSSARRDCTATALEASSAVVLPTSVFIAKMKTADSFIVKLIGILLRLTQSVQGLGGDAAKKAAPDEP